MSYDAFGIVSARLAQVQSTVSSRLAEITSTTGIPFSIVLQKAASGAQTVQEAETARAEEPSDLQGTGTALDSSSGIRALATQAGAQYNVNPELIQALIWAESGGRADAVSGAGAMGLMQLMPYTAESLGVSDPFDPAQNIDGGARLLSSLLERYDGNVNLALAAYNMGSGGLSRTGVTSLDSSYELSMLPSETQSLLSRVSQYLAQYGYTGL